MIVAMAEEKTQARTTLASAGSTTNSASPMAACHGGHTSGSDMAAPRTVTTSQQAAVEPVAAPMRRPAAALEGAREAEAAKGPAPRRAKSAAARNPTIVATHCNVLSAIAAAAQNCRQCRNVRRSAPVPGLAITLGSSNPERSSAWLASSSAWSAASIIAAVKAADSARLPSSAARRRCGKKKASGESLWSGARSKAGMRRPRHARLALNRAHGDAAGAVRSGSGRVWP
mmetsp:Transcript_30099/g.77799  ORF Transcript_30099/g.77799 Transcript_30099/m.77799 type:complete len:229 (-) Transcript_30099:1670-2356(-)